MSTVASEWPNTLPAEYAFVGEAPGDHELYKGIPLVGPSGRIHNMLLRHAGIDRAACLTTNVLDFKLKHNKIESICIGKKDAEYSLRANSSDEPLRDWIVTPVASGLYIPFEIAVPALERLREELQRSQTNIIVALGGVAAWALLQQPYGVMKERPCRDRPSGLPYH